MASWNSVASLFAAVREPRLQSLFLAGAMSLSFAGCPGDLDAVDGGDEAVEDLTIVVEQDKSRILEEEAELQKRRQSVQAERARLENERVDVARKLASLSKKDRKQRQRLEQAEKQILSEQRKLQQKLSSFEGERDKLAQDKTRLLERIARLTQTKGGLTLAQREELIGERERDVARREAQLARRERAVAEREAEVGVRLTDAERLLSGLKTGVGRGVPAPGGPSSSAATASRSSVLKLQRDVRQTMQSKGILTNDLPPSSRPLDGQAAQAIRAKDYASAQQSLTSLQGVLRTIDINQAFVQAKMTRMNKVYQGAVAKLNEGQQKKVLGLLDDVSDSFSDGRYDRANRKINQIYAMLRTD